MNVGGEELRKGRREEGKAGVVIEKEEVEGRGVGKSKGELASEKGKDTSRKSLLVKATTIKGLLDENHVHAKWHVTKLWKLI